MRLPQGTITALITPFRDGRINARAYETDLVRQIESRIDGLVACGTTAEVPTLDEEERNWLIRAAVVVADRKVPVIVGTGTNATSTTIAATRKAERLGADAALVVTPCYSRPSQEGLFRHFEAVAAATDLPIVLYNVPARTGVEISVETVARLAKLEMIVGIKDATGDPERCRRLREVTPGGFRIYSGDDATTCRSIRAGADGTISVISNAFPRRWRVMCLAALAGRVEEARDLAEGMSGIVAAMGLESNPCPIKYLMSLTCPGHSTEVRLPLVPVCAETAAAIRQAHDALVMDTTLSIQEKIHAA